MTAANDNTFYRPGESFLHKADPRLKLVACLLVVVMLFTSRGFGQLSLPALVLAIVLWQQSPLPASFWRACWMLRWLVLFTLLTHLLFTDGRTLMGVSWLSLDGFYAGLRVSLQMLCAVIAASLLSLTTPVEALAAAFAWFVRPFQWLGCDTVEWQKTLLLSTRFLPVVRNELSGLEKAQNDPGASLQRARIWRWALWRSAFQSFVNGLLTKGDQLAREIAEEKVLKESDRLPSLLPLTLPDWLLLVICLLMIIVYGLIGL